MGTSLRPSEDSNRLVLDRGPDVLGQASARAVADVSARNGMPDDFVGADEMIEAVKVLGARIDEDIDVRILTRLVTRIGAEQIQRRHPVRPQLRFDGLEFGDDFVTVHSRCLSQKMPAGNSEWRVTHFSCRDYSSTAINGNR